MEINLLFNKAVNKMWVWGEGGMILKGENRNTRRKLALCITSLEIRFKNPFYIVYNMDILYLYNFTFLYFNMLS